MTELNGVLVRTAVFLMVEVLVQGDTQVGCVFGGSCVLPCHFQPNSDTILHWVRMKGNNDQVHSYYDELDQLGHQDPLYKGRTSLFHDQISGGNASLRLARVNLQDQGRYLCYASTSEYNQETFVTLIVRAAVSRVDIVLVNNTVTCKSGGIFPRPQLTWSVSPHPATVLQNTTEVHEDDQGLYDISGVLTTVYSDTESTYCCSVQNEDCARKARMRLHPPMQSAPKSEVLLPCDASGLDDITWTFNHNQTILRRQAGQEEVVETEWQQHIRDLSESGSLLLYVSSSAQSEGTYRCTLRYADKEDVTHIELKILQDPFEEGSLVALGVIFVVMLAVISGIVIFIIRRIKFKQKKTTKTSEPKEMIPGETSLFPLMYLWYETTEPQIEETGTP
ncbi:butyrophilin subfamily 2 member A2-like [Gadus morhua]|uniref:butyrophilin subfamily 2 member A2-like n=1 Tax=Gadus morhua TaxID=8049 RepID=UPI0011B46B72|nr:butyrophilin subfamily 2 member A2-like [Gadus morhua]